MTWHVWRLSRSNSARLALVRHLPGLEVCESYDAVWLRANEPSDAFRITLAAVPATQSIVQSDGQLIEVGKNVPRGHLPDSNWTSLKEWIDVVPPTAGFSGQAPEPITLQMKRGEREEQATLLLTTFHLWKSYATSAPQVRLDRLTFAVHDDQHVVIRGTPLPPIKGQRFVLRNQIAVEAGWTWEPKVSPEVLSAVLQLGQHEVSLLASDGTWSHLCEDDFVRATRAAVHATATRLTHEH